MPKKKQKIMLHMHQLRDFIDDRYSFYNNYFLNIEPKRYQWKGVKKAFQMGSAVDFGIKQYYLNLDQIQKGYNLNHTQKNEQIHVGDGVLDSQEFKTLPSKIDQTIAMCLINGYISKYQDEDTKEYFHNFKIINFKIPFIFGKKRKLKNDYVIYCSPDLLAENYWRNELFVLEIKTSGEDDKKYSAETLDFQTMCYCWASYRWNFKIPVGVIKRTLMKPRIRQKKDETVSEFQKRLVFDVSDKEGRYFKSGYREVNKDMILNFEKYLIEILHELDNSLYELNKKKNIYKFWKKSDDYWGM